jgi:hypothetical protein
MGVRYQPLPPAPRPMVAAPAASIPAVPRPTFGGEWSPKPLAPAGMPQVAETGMQRMGFRPPPETEAVEGPSFQIQLEPPGPDRLFRVESDQSLYERMRQESKSKDPLQRVVFPPEPVLSRDSYYGRVWPQRDLKVEPNFVCYPALLFEQKNAERYGWDLGILHPIVSAGVFFADIVTLPYHLAQEPCRKECNAGYCLPGDPVPLLLYPPEISVTGAVAEAGTILGLVAIFP